MGSDDPWRLQLALEGYPGISFAHFKSSTLFPTGLCKRITEGLPWWSSG